jgi:hypothetical protein
LKNYEHHSDTPWKKITHWALIELLIYIQNILKSFEVTKLFMTTDCPSSFDITPRHQAKCSSTTHQTFGK